MNCVECVVRIIDSQHLVAYFDYALPVRLVSVQGLERCEIDLFIFQQVVVCDLGLRLLAVELFLEDRYLVVQGHKL